MKNVFKLALCLAFMSVSVSTYAQKFGYINSQELISVMPERDSVELKLTALSREFQEQLEAIQVEYNNKVQDLQKNQNTWSASVRQLKERDLQSLQERFNEFQQTAQQDMNAMQNQLMGPVIQRAEDAIAKVSKAKGLDAVFDVSVGALAYFNEATMVNVIEEVKVELGVK